MPWIQNKWNYMYNSLKTLVLILLISLVADQVITGAHGKQAARKPKNRSAQPQCAATTGHHQYPWWRVEFQDVMFIKTVSLHVKSRKILNNYTLQVRIGMNDIDQLGEDTAFHKNSLCPFHFAQSNTLVYSCDNREVGTKFVSVQMIPNCTKAQSCPTSNPKLILCEVDVMGFPMNFKESYRDLMFDDFDWSGIKNWRQSSTAYEGKPEYASYGMSFGPTNNRKGCENFPGIFSTIHTSDYTTTSVNVRFDGVSMIDKMDFEPHEFTSSLTSRSITGYVSTQLRETEAEMCAKWIDPEDLRNGTIVNLNCQKPLIGGEVELLINVTYDYNREEGPVILVNEHIENCNVHFRGHKIINFAFHKPTKLSHQACPTDKTCSDKLVDGMYGSVMRPSVCTLPSESEAFHWWRVDLLEYHVVKVVAIFGEKHDIEIRVGNVDIAKKVLGNHFSDTVLCKKITDPDNVANGNTSALVECTTPAFGRYVSIQRVKACTSVSCNTQTPELNICEVEVYGFPATVTFYGTSEKMVPGNPSHDAGNNVVPQTSSAQAWHSLEQVFDEAVAVDGIEVYFSQSATHSAKSISLVVTVESAACYNETHTVTKRFLLIPCKLVLGRIVKLHYRWEDSVHDGSVTAYAKIMKFQPNHSKTPFTLRQFKQGKERVTWPGWNVFGSGIAMGEYAVANYSQQKPQQTCSYTSPAGDLYPWWRIQFKSISTVYFFEIEVEKNGQYDKLHDIEVRVGYYDIADAPTDAPFKKNKLCHATGKNRLLETSKRIQCASPLTGSYFSIQMIKRCTDPSICNPSEPNVLKLCTVSLHASNLRSGPMDGLEYNLLQSDKEHSAYAKQSSTLPGKQAALAIDGLLY